MPRLKTPPKTAPAAVDGAKKARRPTSREKLKEQITARVDKVVRDGCIREAEKEGYTITEMVESALTDWYIKKVERTESINSMRLTLLRQPLWVQEVITSLTVLILSRNELPEPGKILRDLVVKTARDFRETPEFQKGLEHLKNPPEEEPVKEPPTPEKKLIKMERESHEDSNRT
jgi:hypothetical protein